jgi:6-phosphogluconolactonase
MLYRGFIGTYTQGTNRRAKGIYTFTLDTKTGALKDLRLAVEADNPSWIALHPAGNYLYAANEGEGGAVSAYSIAPDGSLKLINQKPTRGKSPCHLAINSGASHIIAANYFSGSLTVFPLAGDGAVSDPCQIIRFSGKGPNPVRQEAPHAHSFLFDKTGAFGFAMDLGTDRIMAYQFDNRADEPLMPANTPWCNVSPGAGPRHGVFNSEGNFAYIVNEMNSTLDVLKYNSAEGSFENIQTISCLPVNCKIQSTCAAIKISPDGNFVYASNRGHDSIAVFSVKPDGALDFIEAVSSGGKTPRDFSISPDGNYLIAANQDSDNLTVFRVNLASGSLKKAGEYPILMPVCVIFR